MRPEDLARYILKSQPELVRQRLVHHEKFGARLGLSTRTIVTVPGIGRFDGADLISAAREALSDANEVGLEDLDGLSAEVMRDQSGLALKPTNAQRPLIEHRLDDLIFLSPNQEERLARLESLLNRVGPTAPDFSGLERAAQERSLDDDEAGRILDEVWGGVAALQAHAAAALAAGGATTDDLIPSAMAYYDRFCGPDPSGAEPEAYLTTTLPAYRRELLRRNLAQGLDICLLGALRDDLSPGAWVQDAPDEALWAALQECMPDCDPYSLLGALDIALGRQNDSRYRSFAESAVERLTGAQFPRPDGIDTYELLPIFARVVFCKLTMLEGGAVRPPYWRRMSAWMQAGLLARMALTLKLDLDRLRGWLAANETAATTYAQMLDLQREPVFHATRMLKTALRCEVVGRLLFLRSRHEAAGRSVPGAADIDAAVERLNEEAVPLGWALPGPLEGHRQPTRELPADDLRWLIEAFGGKPDTSVWARLAYLSQLFALGPDLMGCVRQASRGTLLGANGTEVEEGFVRCEHACIVAATRRDTELAREIGAGVAEHAPRTSTGAEAAAALGISMLAAAAFEHEREWAAWLEEELAATAARLPAGEPIESFGAELAALKQILPLRHRIQARAEALCAAAV
jgi:hypothetical protein